MRAMNITMIVKKGKDDMPEIIKELSEKYKPKQLHYSECQYFER